MAAEQPVTRMSAFQRASVATLVATLVLVVLGGAVRATDSGLACPDWPRCYGMWIPPADLHMWLEHSHRLLAGAVGIMIAVLLVWAIRRFRHRPDILWTTAAAAVLVVAQAALGAVVVLRFLQAELVTAHLGMAMAVVACLAVLVVNASRPRRRARQRRELAAAGQRHPALARASAAVAGLCLAQLLVGAHVTGINAGLAFRDFPLMGGAVVPAITSERELFHASHRFLAVVLVLAAALLVVHARHDRAARRAAGAWAPPQRWLVTLPWLALGLVALQIVLGVANLYTETSPVTVIPHLAVASWIWTVLVFQTLLAYRYTVPAGEAVAPASAREEVGA